MLCDVTCGGSLKAKEIGILSILGIIQVYDVLKAKEIGILSILGIIQVYDVI